VVWRGLGDVGALFLKLLSRIWLVILGEIINQIYRKTIISQFGIGDTFLSGEHVQMEGFLFDCKSLRLT
jgi:hypothetical protein